MLIKRKPLARRTFLKGLGVSIGLPYLEIMCAKESFAQENITRTAWVYVPNGWYKNSGDFFPGNTGTNYSSTPFLAPMISHRNDFMVISNLDNAGGRSGNDGPGDHARAAGTYLSSVRILKDQDRVDGGKTIDRHISDQTKLQTPIDMLCMGYGRNDGGDSGYNSLNMRLSWKSNTDPVAWEDPGRAFNRLVSNNNPTQVDQQSQIRANLQKSVLDFVINDDLPRLWNQLGQADREKLDSYLTGLRDVERRISIEPGPSCSLPEDFSTAGNMSQQIDAMYDVMLMAFECDLTRVAVIGLAKEGNNVKPDNMNIVNGWHSTSHYAGDNQKIADYDQIGLWVSQRAERLMTKLNERNLMQSSLISFGAGSGGDNSQGHGDVNFGTLLIGHGNGAVRSGRHLRTSNPKPIANLWATMANAAGVPVANHRWGDFGTGLLDLT